MAKKSVKVDEDRIRGYMAGREPDEVSKDESTVKNIPDEAIIIEEEPIEEVVETVEETPAEETVEEIVEEPIDEVVEEVVATPVSKEEIEAEMSHVEELLAVAAEDLTPAQRAARNTYYRRLSTKDRRKLKRAKRTQGKN